MKKLVFLSLAIIILSTSIVLAGQNKHSYKPKDGYVPNSATAIKIAEAVLIPIYGERMLMKTNRLRQNLKMACG